MAHKNSHKNNGRSGPSQRQLRVGELIRRVLSDALLRGDTHDPELERLSITVGEVRVSPDLKVATVYVMPLGGIHTDEAISALARNAPHLRHMLAREMTMKYVPELRFRQDPLFDQMDETRRLFAQDQVQRDVAADPYLDTDGEGDD